MNREPQLRAAPPSAEDRQPKAVALPVDDPSAVSLANIVSGKIVFPDQTRTEMDPQELKGLAQNIQEVGLLARPHVWEAPDGTYHVLVGARRAKAIISILKWDWVPCVVHHKEMTPKGILELRISENEKRENLSFPDTVKSYRDYLQAKGTVNELAQKTGSSATAISMTITTAEKLDRKFWHLVGNEISKRTAYEIAKQFPNDPERQGEEIAKRTQGKAAKKNGNSTKPTKKPTEKKETVSHTEGPVTIAVTAPVETPLSDIKVSLENLLADCKKLCRRKEANISTLKEWLLQKAKMAKREIEAQEAAKALNAMLNTQPSTNGES